MKHWNLALVATAAARTLLPTLLLASQTSIASIRIIDAADPSASVVRMQMARQNHAVLTHGALVHRLVLPPASAAESVAFLRCNPTGAGRLNLSAFTPEIAAASRQHGLPEALIRAVIHAESAFQIKARSPKEAQGLMQLIPATAKRFGVTNPWDPAQNIDAGSRYLAWLLNRFDNNLPLAVAGYNAGEGAVDRYGGTPPFRETKHYVQRVKQLYAAYHRALHGEVTLTVTTPGHAPIC